MPRFNKKRWYKNKKRNKWHGHNDDNDDNDKAPNGSGQQLSPSFDRVVLFQYLLEYKNGCERLYVVDDPSNNDDNNETIVTVPTATTSTNLSYDKSHNGDEPKQENDDNNNNNNVSSSEEDSTTTTTTTLLQQQHRRRRQQFNLPILTNYVLLQPYLVLPQSLSAKLRKIIHELCTIDVELFHWSVGNNNNNDRRVVISIYSNGLDYYVDQDLVQDERTKKKNDNCLPIPTNQCRPWFYRTDHQQQQHDVGSTMKLDSDNNNNSNDNNPSGQDTTTFEMTKEESTVTRGVVHPYVWEETRKGIAQIEALMDQPGNCLRDRVDKVNFQQLDGRDLSSIEPPKLLDGNSSSSVGADAVAVRQQTWMLVDTVDKMKTCVDELRTSHPTEMAFDMEMWNVSKYTQVTCLIQLTWDTTGTEYVIDTLAPGVWDTVSLLRPFFANPTIVKVGHSIGSLDVRSLHRDFGIFVVNAFDTYEAARHLRLPRGLGLANVCEAYGLVHVDEYMTLKKKYQRTDWRVRPLSDEKIQYGRYDVHYLLPLRRLMIRDLTRRELWDTVVGSTVDVERRMVAKTLASTFRRMERAEDEGIISFDGDDLDESMDVSRISSCSDDDDGYYTPPTEQDPNADMTRQSVYDAMDLRMQPDLMRVITLSQRRCLDLWSHKSENPTKNDTYTSIIYRAGKGELIWTMSHMALYEALVRWRSIVARREEVLPGLICRLDWLVLIALKRPVCEASLRRISYFLPHLLEDANEYVAELLSIVRASLEKDGVEPTSNIRKYNAADFQDKQGSLTHRICVTLGAVVAIGSVTVIVLTLARRRR